MKFRSVLLCITVVFMIGLTAAPALALMATFDPTGPISVQEGESFTIDVFAQGDSAWGDLTDFGFDVDPLDNLLHVDYTGYIIGTDYNDVGGTPDNRYVSGLYWGFGNAGDYVLLATLSFTAVSPGTDILSVSGAWDGTYYGLYYWDMLTDSITNVDFDGSITINVQAVPLPAAGILLAFGLTGLGLARRKRG